MSKDGSTPTRRVHRTLSARALFLLPPPPRRAPAWALAIGTPVSLRITGTILDCDPVQVTARAVVIEPTR